MPYSKIFNNRLNSEIEVYASPELLHCIRERDTHKLMQMNHHKNDVFCLGLSILELGLLRSVDNVISPEKYIDRGKLKKYLNQFQKDFHFNPLLVKVVEFMLEIEPTRRPTFIGKNQLKQINNNQQYIFTYNFKE